MADVATPLAPRPPGEGQQEYADGTQINWSWVVETQNEDYNGFVTRKEMLNVLGYSENYNLRGFGEQSSGLLEIDQSQFNRLTTIFHRNGP